MQSAMATDPVAAAQELQRIQIHNALTYVDQVKEEYSQQQVVYSLFLEIMREFKTRSLDVSGVIERVVFLFRDRPNLIMGFNTFLPPGYAIQVDGERIIIQDHNGIRFIDDFQASPSSLRLGSPDDPVELPLQNVSYSSAVSYVDKVQKRFVHDPTVYQQFLNILRNYQNSIRGLTASGVAEVERNTREAVARLFRAELDLVDEFHAFLPMSQAPEQQ